jgi:hypothetical protein
MTPRPSNGHSPSSGTYGCRGAIVLKRGPAGKRRGRAGLKLPTGSFAVTNSEGVAAERMLQPGTGTTDALVTGFLSRPLGAKDSMFVQLSFEAALDSRDAYRLGNRIYLNLGYNRWLTSRLGLQPQLNFAYKRPEEGDDAEPDQSGGKFIFLSPGLSFDLSQAWQVYTHLPLQLLYQYVNGVQLTGWCF